MGYLIGYISGPVLIGFLIIHFIVRKRYIKKHNKPMGIGKEIGLILLIGIILFGIILYGGSL